MSKGAPDDIWGFLQRQKAAKTKDSSSSKAAASETTENGAETTVTGSNTHLASHSIFFGDQGCGKSSLIQYFLKPSGGAKDVKPTIALDYNYARKSANGIKQIAHIWEIGGDLIEPRLLEIPITKSNYPLVAAFIVCDLSKPQNVIVSVLRSLSALREVLTRRAAELQASNVTILNDLKERAAAPLRGHVDSSRLRPLDIPTTIIGNKADALRSLPTAERRSLLQALRFAAHFFGCSLLTVSANESSSRDTFRVFLSSIALPSGGSGRVLREVDESTLAISKGQDSFAAILIVPDGSGDGRGRLDENALLTSKGVTRDCWGRLTDIMAALFGEADPPPSITLGSQEHEEEDGGAGEGGNQNPFPEMEVDDTRAARDAQLTRYSAEQERKAEMLAKMLKG